MAGAASAAPVGEVIVFRLLTLVVLCSVLAMAGAQEPVVPPAPVAPATDVAAEVNDFYAEYWKAWRERDLARVAEGLAAEFTLFIYVPGQGLAQVDRSRSVESVRQFFQAVHGQEVRWSHSVLTVIPRSDTEAVATLRNQFAWKDGRGEIELSLEVLRKGADGRWRLLRKWSEKHVY
jgi:ketosteroid isomerase-like protein